MQRRSSKLKKIAACAAVWLFLPACAACTGRQIVQTGIVLDPPSAIVYTEEQTQRLQDGLYALLCMAAAGDDGQLTEQTKQNLAGYAKSAARAIEDAALDEDDFEAVIALICSEEALNAAGQPAMNAVAALYGKLASAAGFEGTGRLTYNLALCYYDELYKRDMARFEEYGYSYLKERAEKTAAEKQDIISCVGEENFAKAVRTACALGKLADGGLFQGFAGSLTDSEVVTLVRAQTIFSLSLPERGWRALLSLYSRLADGTFAGTLAAEAEESGDTDALAQKMDLFMRLADRVRQGFTKEHAALLKEGDAAALVAEIFFAFDEQMWQMFEELTDESPKGDYSFAMQEQFGSSFTEYSNGASAHSFTELKAAAKEADSDNFIKILEGYVAGKCPAAAYLIFYDRA